jgi:chemotaxis protein MotB
VKSSNRVKANLRVRHEETEEADSEGSWAISYGDMVTLLLCFFILFFTVDPERTKSEALQQAMMNVFIDASRAPATESTLKAQSVPKGEVTELQAEAKEDWGGKVHKMGSHLVIEFPGVSFFKSGEVNLTEQGRASLEKFTRLFVPFAGSNFVAIQAYTDMKPVVNKSGRKFSDNLELSALRSVATMRVLQNSGIPLARMRVAGFGEMRATARDLANVQEKKSSPFDLARKVVIVIQPEGKTGP